mmetsp:Transcript_29504/g.50312  ORF Transcript_29504/g.50312 Transcript_29504/m.50312 type:complete len:88 (-) Transcript_29504:2041-2304(-)
MGSMHGPEPCSEQALIHNVSKFHVEGFLPCDDVTKGLMDKDVELYQVWETRYVLQPGQLVENSGEPANIFFFRSLLKMIDQGDIENL